jgi:hypothetical protein
MITPLITGLNSRHQKECDRAHRGADTLENGDLSEEDSEDKCSGSVRMTRSLLPVEAWEGKGMEGVWVLLASQS